MLTRRTFLAGAGGSFLVACQPSHAVDPVLPTRADAPLPQLTPTEQLMRATVRLFNQGPSWQSWGTGFFFSLFQTSGFSVPVIVTNHHVVKDWDQCYFSFAARLPDGAPDNEKHIPVRIGGFGKYWIAHPDADLVVIPLAQILAQLNQNGQQPFWITLDQNLIPTEKELNELNAVEQILTVGFPGSLWDEAHNLPLFHRGYTATAPYIDFNGRKEFLIDIATWPGASGSPVLLYNDTPWMNRNGGTVVGGVRAKLLGIVYAVAIQDVGGNVILQEAPTAAMTGTGTMKVPTNLGACIKAGRILEFEPLLVRNGIVKPPPGYVMRAS